MCKPGGESESEGVGEAAGVRRMEAHFCGSQGSGPPV
jgi:hypothetical protein